MKVYDDEQTIRRRMDDEETVKRRRVELPVNDGSDDAPDISVFLPVFNEEENLRPLHAKLDAALRQLGGSAEIIYVDDGSGDNSLAILRELAGEDDRVRVVALRRNYGQTAAMAAGIDAARGRVLIPMDADMQNDPADIARLLAKLDEGYDVVSGWRKNRQDKLITRKIPSHARQSYDLLDWRRAVARLRLLLKSLPPRVDRGCEALRRDAPLHSDLRLVGRCARRGDSGRASRADDGQIEVWVVAHRQGRLRSDDDQVHGFVSDQAALCLRHVRRAGLRRLISGRALRRSFSNSFHKADFVQTPLPVLAMVMLVLGVQFFLMGLLAEMQVRTYHESQAKAIYAVRERIGFEKQ